MLTIFQLLLHCKVVHANPNIMALQLLCETCMHMQVECYYACTFKAHLSSLPYNIILQHTDWAHHMHTYKWLYVCIHNCFIVGTACMPGIGVSVGAKAKVLLSGNMWLLSLQLGWNSCLQLFHSCRMTRGKVITGCHSVELQLLYQLSSQHQYYSVVGRLV